MGHPENTLTGCRIRLTEGGDHDTMRFEIIFDGGEAECQHCLLGIHEDPVMRFRAFTPSVNCPGCEICGPDGREDMDFLCEDCHRQLIRER